MPRTREIAFIFIRLIKNYSPKFMYARITLALLFVAHSSHILDTVRDAISSALVSR